MHFSRRVNMQLLASYLLGTGDRCSYFLVVSSIRSKMFILLGRVLHTVQDVLSSYPCLPYDRVCFLFLRPILHSDSILIFLFCTSFLVVSSIRSKMFLVLIRAFHMTECVFYFCVLSSIVTVFSYFYFVRPSWSCPPYGPRCS